MVKYLSIDLETSGLDPEMDMIFQVGCVLDDFKTPLEDLPKMEFLVLNEDGIYGGNHFALNMNTKLISEISLCHQGKSNALWCYGHEVAQMIANFLETNYYDEDKLTLAGKNVETFDLPFLKSYGWDIPTRHRIIDPAILYWKPEIDGSKLPDLKSCLSRAGFPSNVSHTAVDDAMQIVKVVRKHFGIAT